VGGRFDKRVHVEDEAHRTVPKHGRTSEQILMPKGLAEALDDDLLLTQQFVHDQTAGGIT
jgi:hypothetical protein